MIDNSRIETIKNLDIREYLEKNGCNFVQKGKNILSRCIFHDDDKHPNLSIKYNRFRCFGCGKRGNIIDACMELNRVSFPEAVELLERGQGITPIPQVNRVKLIKEEKTQKRQSSNREKALLLNSKQLDKDTEEYFKQRKLSQAVELVNSRREIPLTVRMNEFKGVKTVLYIFFKHKFIIQKGITKEPGGKRFVSNVGTACPVPLLINKKDNRVFIVEGVEDALSVLTLGFNVITLNSVSNAENLVQKLIKSKEWATSREFVLLLDNDKAGEKALSHLSARLSEENFENSISSYYFRLKENNIKDINDYIILKCE